MMRTTRNGRSMAGTPATPLARAAGLLAGAATVAALWVSIATAYEFYSENRDATGCRACHEDFRGTAPYVSASDGVQWKDPSTSTNLNLHDGHRDFMLDRDCDACHDSGGRFPVSTYLSAGGVGFSPIGCLGCHGRAEPSSGGVVTGTGLRQHHVRNGIAECMDCHVDADPANTTPANEHVFPPYYAMPDADHPSKPANPCNIGGSEGAIAPPRGLDNDGDNVYDGLEAECDPIPARRPTWGRLKSLYR